MAAKGVNAAELLFRAVCGVGWNLYLNLAELRSLCEGRTGRDGWPGWIDRIQDAVIKGYEPSGGPQELWVTELVPRIETVTKGPACRDYPEIAAFLTKILLTNPAPHTGDIQHQLDFFNAKGHAHAGDMLRDPAWSTTNVAARWDGIAPYTVSHIFEAGAASFYPVTQKENNHIAFKVEKHFNSFKSDFVLLAYLTLEFQFLHEYVSHALPIWNDEGLEEVMLLSSTYDWYPRSVPADGIRSFLANKRREKSPDDFEDWRNKFKVFADLVGREKYCRFILTLATIPDKEFSPSAKDNLLVKMRDLPLRDPLLHARCLQLIQVANPDAAGLEALRQHLPMPTR